MFRFPQYCTFFLDTEEADVENLKFPVVTSNRCKEASLKGKQRKKRDLSIWNGVPAQSSRFSNSLCHQRCQQCLGGATVPPTGQKTHKLSGHWTHSSVGLPAVLPDKWKWYLLYPAPNILFTLADRTHGAACVGVRQVILQAPSEAATQRAICRFGFLKDFFFFLLRPS